MEIDDPLLSVSQVARLWGTGREFVASSVERRVLPSLDDGNLISQGRFDVPLIRRSWIAFMRVDRADPSRELSPPEGANLHPAVVAGLEVHSALMEGDARKLWQMSSRASRKGHTKESLVERWTEINNGGYPDASGVGEKAFSLHPLPAAGVRIFAESPALPRASEPGAAARLIAVLPLVWEDGQWKADLPLYEGGDDGAFLPAVITAPVAEDALLDPSRSDGASHP